MVPTDKTILAPPGCKPSQLVGPGSARVAAHTGARRVFELLGRRSAVTEPPRGRDR